MRNTPTRPLPLQPQLRTTLLLALPLLLIVNLLVWTAYGVLMEQLRQQWLAQAESGLDAALITLERERNDLHGDLYLLSNSPTLKAVLDEATPVHLDRLAAEWERYAAINRRYDQIRWLDSGGRERLRINLSPQGAERVTDNQLQDKSNRYYFKEAIALPAGQIYASPIDLNVEHREIEVPYKPMLRLGTPVTDSRGRLQGLLLVNVLAEYLLDDLARNAGLSQSHLLMLDPNGYYLRGFRREQEWGFMFDRKDDSDYRFDKRYPEVWREVVDNGTGRVDAAQGEFIFRTLRYGTAGFGQRYILLAAVLPRELTGARAAQRQLWLTLSLALSLILTLLIFALARYRVCCRLKG